MDQGKDVQNSLHAYMAPVEIWPEAISDGGELHLAMRRHMTDCDKAMLQVVKCDVRT